MKAEPCLAAEGNTSEGPFRGIVADANPAILKEGGGGRPAILLNDAGLLQGEDNGFLDFESFFDVTLMFVSHRPVLGIG